MVFLFLKKSKSQQRGLNFSKKRFRFYSFSPHLPLYSLEHVRCNFAASDFLYRKEIFKSQPTFHSCVTNIQGILNGIWYDLVITKFNTIIIHF